MRKSHSTQSLSHLNKIIMDTHALLEFIRWVDKLRSSHYLYYESRNIEDFKKWMETDEIVQFICQYLKDEMGKQRNQSIYELNPN